MQKGALICLVTHHTKIQSILFFTITQGVSATKRASPYRLNHQYISITAKLAQVEDQKKYTICYS